MEIKMNVDVFVAGYANLVTEQARKDYIEKIIVRNYVPYEEKVAQATRCLRGNITDNVIEVNTPTVYLYYVMSVLDLYTNLAIDPEKPLSTYNALQQYGLVDDIFAIMGNDGDWNEYKTVYQMCQNDFQQNYMEPRGFLQKMAKKLIERSKEIAANLDLEELKKLLKK